MGLREQAMKQTGNAGSSANHMPSYLKSAWYGPARLCDVVIGVSPNGSLPTYTLKVRLNRFPDGINPLDIPEFESTLDPNIPAEAELLFSLIGRPMQGEKGVSWDGSGQYQWNGASGPDCRTSGETEIQVELLKPPAENPRGGYWPAKYKEILDFDVVGAASKRVLDAAEAMAAMVAGPQKTDAEKKAAEQELALQMAANQAKGQGRKQAR